jgi:hypothetical protein
MRRFLRIFIEAIVILIETFQKKQKKILSSRLYDSVSSNRSTEPLYAYGKSL